ncbi:glycosyltransferase [Alkalimonas amylolytica]|uniref:Glycosyltransferase involved in cell wall bisynthesis n=1 Tax=Alkalimonas amylolytica TaxID=152573 RepID=A0A1H4CD98_ALKAM|nr:glycosyltransferase [Alkalimonas amylolytica]SEA58279.1 Glycosyltransferase involved in cell wall bisynthesis [Alkalimonas amylolytica]
MKRVLHITYDMAIGGTEQVINQLIRGMDKSVVEHRICCIEGSVGAIGQALQQEGIGIEVLARQPGFDWALIKGIRQLIKAHRIDIVHCHQYTPWVYGWFAALGTKAKVIFTEHGRFFPDHHRRKAWLINKLMAATTHKITAISKATKAALVEYEFIPAGKIDVIYNGIEPLVSTEAGRAKARQELGISPEQRVIGTVARLDPIKNQAMMLEAFARLAPEFPDVVLLLVGDGPERHNLEQLAGELKINERVIFAGFKSPATDYMALMELFLLPSLSEGTSMTLLEAMSLGIPCIVSDVGGNPEVVQDGYSGRVLPQNTAMELTTAIVGIVSTPNSDNGMQQAAQDDFQQRFAAAAMCAAFATCYAGVHR